MEDLTPIGTNGSSPVVSAFDDAPGTGLKGTNLRLYSLSASNQGQTELYLLFFGQSAVPQAGDAPKGFVPILPSSGGYSGLAPALDGMFGPKGTRYAAGLQIVVSTSPASFQAPVASTFGVMGARF